MTSPGTRRPDPAPASPAVRPLPGAGLRELALLLLGRRVRFRVTGASMEPTLRHGDVVFVDPRAYAAGDPRPGDVVLAGHPFKESVRLVKRVHAVDPETGRLELRGDAPRASSDSRTLGSVPREKLLGRVTSRKTS